MSSHLFIPSKQLPHWVFVFVGTAMVKNGHLYTILSFLPEIGWVSVYLKMSARTVYRDRHTLPVKGQSVN